MEEQILLLEQTQVAESLKCLLSCKTIDQLDADALEANLGRPKKKLKTNSSRKADQARAQSTTTGMLTEGSIPVEAETPDLKRVALL